MPEENIVLKALQAPLGTPDQPDPPDRFTNLSRALNRPARFNVGELGRVGGYFGTFTDPEDTEAYLGRNDSLLNSFKNTAAQTVAGTAAMVASTIGIIAEKAGSPLAGLLGLENAQEYIRAEALKLQDQAEDYRRESEADYPTYRENPDQVFNFGDPQFWLDTIKSVGESAPIFAVLGAGAGALVGRGANAIKAANAVRTGRVVQGAGQLGTALGLSYVEGGIEGYQIFNEAIAEGKNLEEASRAAAATANFNLINAALNFTILTPAFSRAGRMSREFQTLKKAGLAQRRGELTAEHLARIRTAEIQTPGLLKRAGAYAGEAVQESGEEYVNFIAGEYGRSVMNDEDLSFADKARLFAEHIDNPEALYSAFAGAFGGVAQRGLIRNIPTYDANTGQFGRAAARERQNQNEHVQALRKNIVRTADKFMEAQAEFEAALQSGNGIEEAQNNLFSVANVEAVLNGHEGHLAKLYIDIADMDAERARELGVENEDFHELKRTAEAKIKSIEDLSRRYESLEVKHISPEEREAGLAPYRLQLEGTISALRDLKEKKEKASVENRTRLDSLLDDLNLTDTQKELSKINGDIFAIESSAQIQESEADNIDSWWDNKQKRERVRASLGLPSNRNKRQVAAAIRRRAEEIRGEKEEYVNKKKEIADQLEIPEDAELDEVIQSAIEERSTIEEGLQSTVGEVLLIEKEIENLTKENARLGTRKGRKQFVEAHKKGKEQAEKKEVENLVEKIKQGEQKVTPDKPETQAANNRVEDVENADPVDPPPVPGEIGVGSVVKVKPEFVDDDQSGYEYPATVTAVLGDDLVMLSNGGMVQTSILQSVIDEDVEDTVTTEDPQQDEEAPPVEEELTPVTEEAPPQEEDENTTPSSKDGDISPKKLKAILKGISELETIKDLEERRAILKKNNSFNIEIARALAEKRKELKNKQKPESKRKKKVTPKEERVEISPEQVQEAIANIASKNTVKGLWKYLAKLRENKIFNDEIKDAANARMKELEQEKKKKDAVKDSLNKPDPAPTTIDENEYQDKVQPYSEITLKYRSQDTDSNFVPESNDINEQFKFVNTPFSLAAGTEVQFRVDGDEVLVYQGETYVGKLPDIEKNLDEDLFFLVNDIKKGRVNRGTVTKKTEGKFIINFENGEKTRGPVLDLIPAVTEDVKYPAYIANNKNGTLLIAPNTPVPHKLGNKENNLVGESKNGLTYLVIPTSTVDESGEVVYRALPLFKPRLDESTINLLINLVNNFHDKSDSIVDLFENEFGLELNTQNLHDVSSAFAKSTSFHNKEELGAEVKGEPKVYFHIGTDTGHLSVGLQGDRDAQNRLISYSTSPKKINGTTVLDLNKHRERVVEILKNAYHNVDTPRLANKRTFKVPKMDPSGIFVTEEVPSYLHYVASKVETRLNGTNSTTVDGETFYIHTQQPVVVMEGIYEQKTPAPLPNLPDREQTEPIDAETVVEKEEEITFERPESKGKLSFNMFEDAASTVLPFPNTPSTPEGKKPLSDDRDDVNKTCKT